MAYNMKSFSGFKSQNVKESVPDGEGEVNLSKSSGLGPRTSFGGSKNPELVKKFSFPKKKGPSCWKGYRAAGKKKSPSGKKTSGGRTKMVNNCVKIGRKKR